MNTDVEAVKSRYNIVDVIGEKVKLKRAGRNYFGLCPFHNEKSPSFSVNEEIQRYKCFGCGEAGDVFTFLMKTENLEFREALEELAEKINYKLSKNTSVDKVVFDEIDKALSLNSLVGNWFQKNLLNSENEGKVYAKKRLLTLDLIKKFGVGYAPKSYDALLNFLSSKYKAEELEKYSLAIKRENKFIDKFRHRLMFNIYDEKGKIVGFAGRFIGKDTGEFKTPKYLNSSETILFHKSKLLFGLYQAKDDIRRLKFSIVTEGQMNVISSSRIGVGNIVASLGTSLSDQHLKILSRYSENVYFAFDKDNAGKKALLRAIEMGFRNDLNIKVISWDSTKGGDPDELITFNPKLWINAVNNPLDPIEYLFNEFKHKFVTFNSDNATSFLRLTLGLLQHHQNKVKVEYYLKFLSEKFDLKLESIKDLDFKIHKSMPRKEEKKEDSQFIAINARSNLFDKIFSLILQNWQEESNLILMLERDFLPDEYQELYDMLSLFTDTSDVQSIRNELPEELKDLFDELVLMNNYADESKAVEEHISKLIPMCKIEYKKRLIAEWKNNPENDELLDKINKVLNNQNDI